MMRSRLMNVDELLELLLRDRHELAGGRVIGLGLLPGRERIAAVHARGDAAELLLRGAQLAHARSRAGARRRS